MENTAYHAVNTTGAGLVLRSVRFDRYPAVVIRRKPPSNTLLGLIKYGCWDFCPATVSSLMSNCCVLSNSAARAFTEHEHTLS